MMRGKLAPMAVRVESCNSWFLAARLVTNIPGGGEGGGGRGGRGEEEEEEEEEEI